MLTDYAIVIGTIGHSVMTDSIIKANKINIQPIKDQWERFIIRVIDQPSKKVKRILLIAGSDRRGTAFGVFELSRKMGVSPFYWWADVTPTKRKQLFVSANYRLPHLPLSTGVFLLMMKIGAFSHGPLKHRYSDKRYWAGTYAKVFELMLRSESKLYLARHASLHKGILLL